MSNGSDGSRAFVPDKRRLFLRDPAFASQVIIERAVSNPASNPDSVMAWQLPVVDVDGVPLAFWLDPVELSGVVRLLAQVPSAFGSMTSLAERLRLPWATCPTFWGWLVASSPELREQPLETWLEQAPNYLGSLLKQEFDRPDAPGEWLLAVTDRVRELRPLSIERLQRAIENLNQDPAIETLARRRAASALLLLEASRPPRIQRSPQTTTWRAPNWHGQAVCRLVQDLRRGIADHEVVTTGLRAQRAAATSDTEFRPADVCDWSATASQLARALSRQVDFEERLRQEKLASLKQLAYGASHEINNPLANISTRAQTLLRDESDPDRRQKLAAIVSQAFRAHDMISNMMLFAHPPALRPQEFSPATWLESQEESLQFLAQPQSTELTTQFDASHAVPAVVWGDPEQLGVLLQCLVRNACEALGEGGHVRVTLGFADPATPSGPWRISVSDNGPGMSSDTLRHCFDPFYSGREAGRGLGFGLSKAWTICRLHHGELTVQSLEPTGLVFHATLPACKIGATSNAPSTKADSCKSTPTVG